MLLSLAAALIAAASPDAAAAPAPQASPAAPAAKPARVCIVDTATGSRIPMKVCKTRTEWKAQGVDLPQR
jgi:hypothetical protein